MLLARRLKAAIPDVLRPGKAWENHQEKASFLLGFSLAFLGQKPLTSVTPNRLAQLVFSAQLSQFAYWSPEGETPAFLLLNF